MAAVLRIILLLLPLLAAALWLRWRLAHAGDPEALDREFKGLRTSLIAIAAAIAVIFLALWSLDGNKGDAHTRYVPPHAGEDGKVVPGHFEPQDDTEDTKREPEPQH